MKWINHRITATATVLILGGGIFPAAMAYLGSTLPDVLEGKPPAETGLFGAWRKRQWSKKHRGASHWFGWFVIASWLAWIYAPPLHWIFIGGLLHLAGDALTPGGIPLLPVKNGPRISAKLFYTGSLKEYLFVAMFLAAGFIYKTW